MQRLPPPPPPPPPAVPSTSRSQMDNPVYCGMGQTLGPVHLAMQHLQPPPPPPPLAVPSTSRSQMHNPVYCGMGLGHNLQSTISIQHPATCVAGQTPQPSTSFATCHSPTAVPIFRFDARRPPPPIHTHVQLNNNNLTRTMLHSCTAPPSKLRRMEEPKPDDALCDVCVQREICIEICRIKMENLSAEHESQSLLNRKKLIEYQKHKDFLRSLVNSKLFRKIEEYVEDVPQNNIQSVLNNLNDSLQTGHSSSNPNQSSQSVRVEDSLLQTLSAMSRSVSRSSPDVLQTLQEMLSNDDRTSSSERPRHGELTIERGQSSSSNGVSSFHPYSNAQSQSNGRRSSPAYAIAPASAPVTPSAAPAALPAPPPAVTYPHYPPPPPVTYPHYPPSRSYYPHPYLPSPTPTTSRAPMPPRPPHGEQYPPPYYY